MSETKQFLKSQLNYKSDCCEARLIPLIRRIEFLENKLNEEIQLRENDYNYLLHLLLKDQSKNTGNKLQQRVISIKERKSKVQNRIEKSPELVNKKQALKQVISRRVSTKPNQFQTLSEPLILKKDIEIKPSDSFLAIDQRTKLVQLGLQHQQNELDKIKELNEQLMDQMLVIFEKIKQLEVKEISKVKQIQSLQTISSMLVQGEARQDHIKIINNLTNNRKSQFPQLELTTLISKVAEHENVLSELIQLTREVSSQISFSPKKPKQI